MHQKFIVNEGRLKMGVVDQHRELASDHSSTLGGGWWHMDKDSRVIWLYYRSQLFGRVSKKMLKEVIDQGKHDYPGFSFYYSPATDLASAIATGEKL